MKMAFGGAASGMIGIRIIPQFAQTQKFARPQKQRLAAFRAERLAFPARARRSRRLCLSVGEQDLIQVYC